MTRTLLIDADILAYRSSAVTQRSYQWDGPAGDTSIAASLDDAIEAAEQELDSLFKLLKPDDIIICLSDDLNSFRKDQVDPTYKAVRGSTERPVHLYDMKDWMRETYTVEECPYLEADDVMGILATDPNRTDERIIVSMDKDMMTIPGLLFRPHYQVDDQKRPLPKPRILEISEQEAWRFHFWQTLVGDTTDGYGGCPGIGPKSEWAEEVLETEDEEEAWEWVLCAYHSKGLSELDALKQARLARILQYPDYDGKRPKLWLPPYLDASEVE